MPIRWKHELQDLPPEEGAKRHYFTLNDGDTLLLHTIYQSGEGRGDVVKFELPDGKIESVSLPRREDGLDGVKASAQRIMEIKGLSPRQQAAALFMMASVCKLQSTQYGLEFEIPIPAKPTQEDIKNIICDPFMMATSSAFCDYSAARMKDRPLPEIRHFNEGNRIKSTENGYIWRHKITSACRNWGSKLHWFEFSPANDPGYGLIGFTYASGPKTGTKLTVRTSDTILDQTPFSPVRKTIDLAEGFASKDLERERKFRISSRVEHQLIKFESLVPEETMAGYSPYAGQYVGSIMLASLYNLLSTRYDKPFDWIDLPERADGKSLQNMLGNDDMTQASQLTAYVAARSMQTQVSPGSADVLETYKMMFGNENPRRR